MKKEMPKVLYWLIQLSWGCLQTLAGFFLYLLYFKNKHFRYRNAIITVWSDGADSLSLGPFIFISGSLFRQSRYNEGEDWMPALARHFVELDPGGPTLENGHPWQALQRLLRHEYGHSIQSMILGPFYLLLVGIPSIFWCRIPAAGRSWRTGEKSYYSFITERSADRLGGNSTDRQKT